MSRLDRIKGNTYSPTAAGDINWLLAELERQSATLDKMPLNANGERIVPGTPQWYVNQFGEVGEVEVELTLNGDPLDYIDAGKCYSTREAAEAAKAKERR